MTASEQISHLAKQLQQAIDTISLENLALRSKNEYLLKENKDIRLMFGFSILNQGGKFGVSKYVVLETTDIVVTEHVTLDAGARMFSARRIP